MVKKMRTALQEFIALESSAGIILFGAALLAMVTCPRLPATGTRLAVPHPTRVRPATSSGSPASFHRSGTSSL